MDNLLVINKSLIHPGEEDGSLFLKETTSLRAGKTETFLVWLAIRTRIFYFACVILKRPARILRVFRALINLRNTVWAGNMKKLYRVGNKYHFNQYTPGWPSSLYDELLKSEIRRYADPLNIPERLSFVFLAITRKCPLSCEHCFEWDNLNKKETSTLHELKKVIDICQQQGVLQFHFSGGEPMVRIKDLLTLMEYASMRSECWVVTSGFNLTRENAVLLKKAGCKGIVVSIDHYIPELHNRFRGSTTSFQSAVTGVQEALRAGMVVSVSVCSTREFIDGGHLLPYMDFAKKLGVHFVQILEPKNVGHYSEKDVLLFPAHIRELESLFTTINYSSPYRHYPTLLYHGYHQRRVGCFSGSRSIYIDSIGDVHACPFCHTKSYNILERIRKGETDMPSKENKCPRYEQIG
jgi:MoaA/NifB/PqqE/SkfB family radical SAM enzyme